MSAGAGTICPAGGRVARREVTCFSSCSRVGTPFCAAIRWTTSGESKQTRLPPSPHYSSVFTLSAEDAQRIRAVVTEAIGGCVGIVEDSRDEQVHALAIDLFRLDRQE